MLINTFLHVALMGAEWVMWLLIITSFLSVALGAVAAAKAQRRDWATSNWRKLTPTSNGGTYPVCAAAG